jgi:hypothetical protein
MPAAAIAWARMRGATTSLFALVVTLISSGLGPYWVGKISGMTGSLATGMYSLPGLVPVGAVCRFAAAARMRVETAEQRSAWAAAEGEDLTKEPQLRRL